MSHTSLLIAALALLAGAGQQAASKPAVSVPFFGNEKCPISGKATDHSKMVELDGQPVFLCCGLCAAKANGDAKATAAKAYPSAVAVGNKLCPVMGEPIDDSKSTVTIAGKTLRLCCDDCGAEAKKSFGVALAKASNEKLSDLANKKCVCGKDAAGQWVAVSEGKIVRLCSSACADAVQKDPSKLASVMPPKK